MPGRRRQRPPNIRDVAAAAGVSGATVSKVLNDRGGVREEIRARVLEVAERLHYVPNIIGKAVNRKATGFFGAVMPTNTPHFLEMVRGINNLAELTGVGTLIGYAQDRVAEEARILQVFRQIRLDGIVLAPVPAPANRRLIESIREQGIPLVLLERRLPGLECDYVGGENAQTARAETERLFAAGHRGVGFVRGSAEYTVVEERLEGYREALRAAGVEPREEWIVQIDSDDAEEEIDALLERLETEEVPRAFLWNVNFLAILSDALAERGWRNGEEIEVVLFDVEAGYYEPRQPFRNLCQYGIVMGEEALRILLQRLGGELAGEPVESTLPFKERPLWA